MKLTTITKIIKLESIEGADRIERVTVLGWQAIVQKGIHRVGDMVVFIFPDTHIPKKLLDSKCDGDEKVRLKTVKMRGHFSAGLVLPLHVLPLNVKIEEGQDVANFLNVEKYESPVPANLAGSAEGRFPTFLVNKTDEDNYRSNPDAWDELFRRDFENQEILATVKYDGSSGTFIFDPNENKFRVCSRNLELKEDGKNTFWQIARKYKIEEVIKSSGRHLAIQGEVVGPGIQGNNLKLNEVQLFIFLIKDLDRNTWLSWDETVNFCRENHLQAVEEIGRWKNSEIPTKEELQSMANSVKYGEREGEGLVLRPQNPIPSNALQKSWWSLKFVNEIYDSKK